MRANKPPSQLGLYSIGFLGSTATRWHLVSEKPTKDFGLGLGGGYRRPNGGVGKYLPPRSSESANNVILIAKVEILLSVSQALTLHDYLRMVLSSFAQYKTGQPTPWLCQGSLLSLTGPLRKNGSSRIPIKFRAPLGMVLDCIQPHAVGILGNEPSFRLYLFARSIRQVGKIILLGARVGMRLLVECGSRSIMGRKT